MKNPTILNKIGVIIRLKTTSIGAELSNFYNYNYYFFLITATQRQKRMALRKQVKHISDDNQQMDENTQEDDSATDGDTGVRLKKNKYFNVY